MTKIPMLAVALLLMTTSTAASAQDAGTAAAPAVKPPARTAEAAKGFTIDQKGVKRTGDPLPDVDVSMGRPGRPSAAARTAAPSNAFTIDQKGVKRGVNPGGETSPENQGQAKRLSTASSPQCRAMSVAFDDHGEMVPMRGTTSMSSPRASAPSPAGP